VCTLLFVKMFCYNVNDMREKNNIIIDKINISIKALKLYFSKLSLRNRILLFTSLTILSIIIAILIVINVFIFNQVQSNLEEDLFNTKMVLEEFQDSRYQKLLSECRMLAQQSEIKEIILTDNPIAIAYETEKYHQLINSELFAIITKSGAALKIIDKPYKYGDNLFNASIIDEVLKGKEMIVSISQLDKIFQVVFVPIKLNNEVIGTVSVGYEIDKKLALELKKVTLSEVSFIVNQQIIASTLPLSFQQQLEKQLIPRLKIYFKQDHTQRFFYDHDITLGKEHYISLVIPINPNKSPESGLCLIQKSIDQAMAFVKRLRNGLITIGFIALIISLGIVFSISKTITNPLNKLMIGVKRLKSGDYDHEVKVKGGGEVELLANAFDDMRISLKKQIQQVKTSEDLLRRVIESSSDAIFTLDLKGRFTFINLRMELLTKYTDEELKGKPFEKLITREKVEQIRESIKKAATIGMSTLQQEVKLLPKEGYAATVLISLAPLFKNYQVYSIVGTITDISERIELEKRLLQTERLASMGQTAASLAHEINNPLSIILGFTQDLLSEVDEKSTVYKNLKIIEQETSRCAEVVKNLLDFTRSRPLEIRHIKLDSLLESSLSLVKIKMKKLDITVEKHIPSDLPLIKADATQLRQVIINILLNSIQSMPNGGKITVSASYEVKNKTANEITIELADTGKGIPSSELKRIFDPFYSRRKPPGTGLGLAISKQIIEGHQGNIFIESTSGKGTKCIIRLPIAKPALTIKK
jgi:PAS domain S-box-containing protein